MKTNFTDMLEFSLYNCAFRLQESIRVLEDNFEDQELLAKQIEEMTGKRPVETEEELETKQAGISALNHYYEALGEIKDLIEKRYGKGEFKNWLDYNSKFYEGLSWDDYAPLVETEQEYKEKGFVKNSPSYDQLKHILKEKGYHRYCPEKEATKE